jgi:hypothetical protein
MTKDIFSLINEDSSYYPEDHLLGMVVPKGGSDCAKCKFLSKLHYCKNKGFQKWMKDTFPNVDDPSMIPAPADEYCCDLFITKK